MKEFRPSLPFSDAWASVGNLTFYHRDGKCFVRKKASPAFPATQGQQDNAAIHRRAIQAWQSIPHEVQLQWGLYARDAEPHRPPFDHSSHISGYNLFVSAYHGFARLGNEHTPEPRPFVPFPSFTVKFNAAHIDGDGLTIPAAIRIDGCEAPDKYRLLVKLQLAAPGGGCHPGKMRNFLADGRTGFGEAAVTVPAYRSVWGLDLPEYQAHARLVLIDSETGYRSQYRQITVLLSVNT